MTSQLGHVTLQLGHVTSQLGDSTAKSRVPTAKSRDQLQDTIRHTRIFVMIDVVLDNSGCGYGTNQPAVVDTSFVCGSPTAALLEANPTTTFLSTPLVLVEYFFRSASNLAELNYGI